MLHSAVPLARLRAILKAIAGSTFSSLAVPDYRRLYFGNMAFQFSNWMQQLTFGWLLLTIGNSPFWLGVSGSCYAVAMIAMGPVGGALADTWERRRVMMLTQMTAVVVNAAVALLYWLGELQIWHLLAAAILMGFSFTLNMPARQSLMAELVPRRLLHNATAIHVSGQVITKHSGIRKKSVREHHHNAVLLELAEGGSGLRRIEQVHRSNVSIE